MLLPVKEVASSSQVSIFMTFLRERKATFWAFHWTNQLTTRPDPIGLIEPFNIFVPAGRGLRRVSVFVRGWMVWVVTHAV